MTKDFRTCLAAYEEAGEILRIRREVDPKSHLAGLAWQGQNRLDKATVFESLKGYPGWQAASYVCGSRKRIALALDTDPDRFVPHVIKTMERGLTKCQMVASGPVKEVVWTGADANLERLPLHVHSNIDPGPYIGNMCIVKDPETGIRNVAVIRFQIKDKHKMGVDMAFGRHTYTIYEKYRKRNEPMPIALAIGHHPAYYIAACWTTDLGVDEMEIAGTLLGEPVQMVKCETIDLEVPAHTELVIEGLVPPDVMEMEGPFGEHAGLATLARLRPIVNVTAITMRHDRIYYALQAGRPIAESQILDAAPMEAVLFQRLRPVGGFVDLKDVVVAPYAGGGHICIVQMVPKVEGQVRNVLLAALSSPYLHPKIAIAVDDDVNPHDPKEVLWSISTRVNPQDDIFVIPNTAGLPIDVSLPQIVDGEWATRLGSKIAIDATKPPTRRPKERLEFERIVPKGLEEVRIEDFLS